MEASVGGPAVQVKPRPPPQLFAISLADAFTADWLAGVLHFRGAERDFVLTMVRAAITHREEDERLAQRIAGN